MFNRTDCDSGMAKAPNAPCAMRASTSSGRLEATPHSIEARVKPATESRSVFFAPITVVIQPETGVIMAPATM